MTKKSIKIEAPRAPKWSLRLTQREHFRQPTPKGSPKGPQGPQNSNFFSKTKFKIRSKINEKWYRRCSRRPAAKAVPKGPQGPQNDEFWRQPEAKMRPKIA